MEKYLATGNEYISLPEINEETCSCESLSFLLMAQRGMIELRGTDRKSLFRPFVSVNGSELSLQGMNWSRKHYWIPTAEKTEGTATIRILWCAPSRERGFMIRMELSGIAPGSPVALGLGGTWASSAHCVNEAKPLEGSMHCYESGWNHGIILDYRVGFPVFAFAPMCDKETETGYRTGPEGIEYSVCHHTAASPEGTAELTIYLGFGFEEVAAATSAKEMLRRGWDAEYKKTAAFLKAREKALDDPALTQIYNTNLFFCMFYAFGQTLDTEELVCVTSRSPRYYVSAAYWDRDTLLWAFPAILEADPVLAKKILQYVFTRQGRNHGIHSRYIDGTVLEPGFELDELMAPVLALAAYTKSTGDTQFKEERFVLDSVDRILTALGEMKHPTAELYETFLQPTDDERVYPYLTYNNMLVWKALRELAGLYPDRLGFLTEQAENIRSALYENCVFSNEQGKPYFGWSVDLESHHDIYDEPPGSLQLLPYYGFCDFSDKIWRNTVDMIRSPDYRFSFSGYPIAEIGCPHAPYPWVLSLCNSLLCGYQDQAKQELKILKMDNGIACESVDPVTGECATGAAFATCAGFLCHAILTASEVQNEK